FQLLGMLVAGGTVVIAPDGNEQDPAALARLLADERITALELVPSMLRVLLDEPGSASVKRLRWLTSAGEALHSDVCERAREVFGTEVYNIYGPAECAIGATEHRFVAGTSGAVPLGAPLENIEVVVLDDGKPVKPGGVGEIHLGGVGVARGYLGNPALTAEKFVPAANGERRYRTGDLQRQDRPSRAGRRHRRPASAVPRAAHAVRAPGGAGVVRGTRHRPDRYRRRLLPARRLLAAPHPGRREASCAVRAPPAGARAVHRVDPGRAGE